MPNKLRLPNIAPVTGLVACSSADRAAGLRSATGGASSGDGVFCNIEPAILDARDGNDVADLSGPGSSHAVPVESEINDFATVPGEDLTECSPAGSISCKADLGPILVPAGDYQIHIALPKDPGTVVFGFPS